MKFIERNLTWILVGLGLILLAGVIIQVVTSLPPRKFTILTGREGGGYYKAAQAYQKIAKEKGFDLEIRPTAGSSETLKLLEAGEAGIGFVQGGVAAEGDPKVLGTLANVFYEPIWFFHRKDAASGDPVRMQAFKGKRIAVGEEGSGTKQLATQLLASANITAENTTLLSLPSAAAADKLAKGEIEAAVFVVSDASALPWDLLRNPDLDLLSVEQASAAYAFRYPFLTSVVLPAFGADVAQGIPAESKTLLATTANLVVRNDFHPDLDRLMILATVLTHQRGGLFEKRFEFPNVEMTDLPIDIESQAYLDELKKGNSFLDNHFPFWLAALIERYLLFILPLALIVLPIVGRSPLVYQWYMRNKVLRWYNVVHAVEQRIDTMQLDEVSREIQQLDELDDKLGKELSLSNTYMPSVYDLRSHVEFVIAKLEKRKQQLLRLQTGDTQTEPAVMTP